LNTKKLRIGRIPYANLFPIFYYLDRKCDNSEYRFIRGVPSRLNKMLRNGELDISPSSSIEYLRNRDKYLILPSFSISSSGAIDSILLFSKLPIDRLEKKTIAVSSDSETSVLLLKIILREFYSLKCRFRTVRHRSVKTPLSGFPAVLFIGDTAMKEKQSVNSKKISPSPIHIYDLGEIWHRNTGLPFVFALWIARKDSLSEKKELIKRFSLNLVDANRYMSKHLRLIAKETPQNKWLSEKDLVSYWKKISYGFTEKHIEGLRLFEKYAMEMKTGD
jgi:chorismate dehydratase